MPFLTIFSRSRFINYSAKAAAYGGCGHDFHSSVYAAVLSEDGIIYGRAINNICRNPLSYDYNSEPIISP